jgi:membrane-associated phospholipid phosphatase
MWLRSFFERLVTSSFPRLLAVLLLLALLSPVSAQTDVIGAEVSAWQTWILEDSDQLRLDAPPDTSATAEELEQLLAMVDERDETALQQIAYWNSGPPSYRWNQIAIEAILKRGIPTPTGLRALSLVHVAIYDATVAAWDSKYAYERPHPSELEPSLETVIPNPATPSYPCELSVTAGAASTVLAWLFPDDAAYFEQLANEAAQSRLMAGVEYPSDVEAGLELGWRVAELVIERGDADGSSAEWTGSIPTEAGMWTGENPGFPTAATWLPWALSSPDQFRPGPRFAYDSDDLAAEMAEIRDFEHTPAADAAAMFWEYGAGGRRIHWFWNEIASRLILEARLHDNAPEAARAYALMNIAGYDAIIACWDAKYTYWAMRPFQIDPDFKPLFTTPNHPSYPSAHACISTAISDVLADLFPASASQVTTMAQEAVEARIWGGIHFRSDALAGQEIGHNVASTVLAWGTESSQ